MHIIKTVLILVVIAALLATFVPSRDYEAVVADIEIRQLQQTGSQCPLSREVQLAATPIAVRLCHQYGLYAYLDALEDVASAETVYGLSGSTTELQTARSLYGHKVVAVIDLYHRNGSQVADAKQSVGYFLRESWQQLQADPLTYSLPSDRPELTPEAAATYALLAILEAGEIFLVQFELQEDGTAKRKPIETAAQSTYSFLLGGVRNVERKLTSGQSLTYSDYGNAALDGVVMFAGWKLLTTAGSASAAAVKTGKVSKLGLATTKAAHALTTAAKVTKVGAVVAVASIAVTEPTLLVTGFVSAANWIASTAGLPGWLGSSIAWFVLLVLLWSISYPVRWLLGRLPWRLVHKTAC